MSRVPNVVIVDDHPAEQALLRYFLSQKGIASTSLSPRAGLEPLVATAPDIVLLDEPSASGSSVRLCAELKARLPATRVVLLTAHEATLRAADPLLGGADAVLAKPMDFASLERVVRPILEGGAEAAQKRVLVIDDDGDTHHVIARVLAEARCVATFVQEPREILRQPPGDGFDLVLIDLVMPEVNGLEVCFFLRQHYGDDLRICIMTSSQDPESVRTAADYGADGWVTKPLQPADLLKLVGIQAQGSVAPIAPAPAPVVSRPASSSACLRRPHVLVVDDDRDILEYCRSVFAGAGAVVDAIQDPSTLRDSLPPGGSYDLILLDIFMPAVDGIELLRRFSADVKNMSSRFYIITADENPAMRTLAQRSGADGYLTKPLRSQALLELLAA